MHTRLDGFDSRHSDVKLSSLRDARRGRVRSAPGHGVGRCWNVQQFRQAERNPCVGNAEFAFCPQQSVVNFKLVSVNPLTRLTGVNTDGFHSPMEHFS